MADNQFILKVSVPPQRVNPNEWLVSLIDLNSDGAFWLKVRIHPLPDKSCSGIIEDCSNDHWKDCVIHLQVGSILQKENGEENIIKPIDTWTIDDRTLWWTVMLLEE